MSVRFRPGTDVKVAKTNREGTVVKDLGKNRLEACMCDSGENEVYSPSELEILEFTY